MKNMKKIRLAALLLLLFLSGAAVHAQLVRWAVPPVYDNVYASEDGLFVADSAAYKILWANDSIKGSTTLFRTTEAVNPYREGRAVLTRPNSKTISGFMLPDGRALKITRGTITDGYPYFSEGYLVVTDVDRVVFYNKDGRKSFNTHLVANAKPFHSGVSACLTYQNFEKKKNPYYYYLGIKGDQMMPSVVGGKAIGKTDMQYASSVGGEGFGVVVAKNLLYKYTPADGKLHPFLLNEGDASTQLNLTGNIDKSLTSAADGGVVLTAKTKGGEQVSLFFDAIGMPVKATIGSSTIAYKTVEAQQRELSPSTLSVTGSEGSYGLMLDGEEVLPAQLQQVGQPNGNYIPAKLNDRWGVLYVDEDYDMMLSVNGGGDLYFDKSQLKSTILLILPVNFLVNESTEIVVDSKQLNINKDSRTAENTLRGNYVEYDCTLTSPGKSKTMTFPVTVSYDGLHSRVLQITANVTTAKPKPAATKPSGSGSSGVAKPSSTPTTKSGTEIKIEPKPKKAKKIAI